MKKGVKMPEELKNALGSMNWGNWAQGLVAAILGGAVDYLIILNIAPGMDWKTALSAAGIMGVKQGLLFMKSTPMPVLLTQRGGESTAVTLQQVGDVTAMPAAPVEPHNARTELLKSLGKK